MITPSILFQHYLDTKSDTQQKNLKLYEEDIIGQALANIGLKPKTALLSTQEAQRLAKELEQIVHLDGRLPCLIGRDTQDKLIDPKKAAWVAMSTDEINAHNFLLHLARGAALSEQDDAHYSQSFLAHPDVINHFLIKRNPRLMQALKNQMQLVFDNAASKLQSNAWSKENIRQYEVFQSNLLSLYPFWDPQEGNEGDKVRLPQYINKKWELVTYQFKRFDISPKSGPLSWVMEDEDRMYSFALEPEDKNMGALAHLLLMGTIYPAGQGQTLANIHNFCPAHSVGEQHNMSEVHDWLKQQASKSVRATGHSKGAAMAMIIAGQHPDKILQSDCLNPPVLTRFTMQRLAPSWNKLRPEERPIVNVYAQKGDPIFLVENNFLPGTHIYRVIPNTNKPAINIRAPLSLPIPKIVRKSMEAHVHYFSGREQALFLKVNPSQERKNKARTLLSDMKFMYDWLYFPIEYTSLFIRIVHRKIDRFYKKYELFFMAGIIAAALLASVALSLGTPLAPLVLFAFAKLGLAITASASAIIANVLVSVGVILTPFALQLAHEIAIIAAKITRFLLIATAAVVGVVVGGTVFALRSGVDLISESCSKDNETVMDEQTEIAPAQNQHSFFNRSASALDEQSQMLEQDSLYALA